MVLGRGGVGIQLPLSTDMFLFLEGWVGVGFGGVVLGRGGVGIQLPLSTDMLFVYGRSP